MPDTPSFTLPEIALPKRVFGRRSFDFSRQVAVMAIVNRTPDSFFDQGRTYGLTAAVEAAERAAEEGADWLDIGGVRFGPGLDVSEGEELDRVVPVVTGVRGRTDAVISVDTFRAAVAREAIAAGADVVNDTSGLHDPDMAPVVAATGAGLVIVHSLGRPRQQIPRPTYPDVVEEAGHFLAERVALALRQGVAADRIVVDPGHDLNKNTLHSLELTRRLGELTVTGQVLLVSVSNKDFIGETLDQPVDRRQAGTLSTVVACVLQGARVVRVHDVPSTVDAVRMIEAVLGWRSPAYTTHNT